MYSLFLLRLVGVACLMVAGAGFEPYDLRVMSPMSYQTALPRDITIFLHLVNATHFVGLGVRYARLRSPDELPDCSTPR